MRILLAISVVSVALAQSADAPAFEVVSIKAAPPPAGRGIRFGTSGGPGSTDPGRVTVENMALRDLILNAYHLAGYQLEGPDWMASTRFDIVAKVPPNSTKEQVAVMWQGLFADRFQLTSHRESKEMATFALVVAKGGPRLAEATDDATTVGTSGASGSGAGIGMSTPGAGVPRSTGSHMQASKMSMQELAASLSRSAGRPVVDETGLTGRYKFSLDWQPEDMSPVASENAGPSLANALQEQLGLKLESRKSTIEKMVVDHVERTPREN